MGGTHANKLTKNMIALYNKQSISPNRGERKGIASATRMKKSETVRNKVTIGETMTEATRPIGVRTPNKAQLMGVVASCAPADAEIEFETAGGRQREVAGTSTSPTVRIPARAP